MERLVIDPKIKDDDGSTENVGGHEGKRWKHSISVQAQGASCLEYEPTIPTKFMVGTEQGGTVIRWKGNKAVLAFQEMSLPATGKPKLHRIGF